MAGKLARHPAQEHDQPHRPQPGDGPALGLHRIGETVEVPDNAATRGMVRQVRFLVDRRGDRRTSDRAATPQEKA